MQEKTESTGLKKIRAFFPSSVAYISQSQTPFSKQSMYQEAHKTLCKAWKDTFTLTSKTPMAMDIV